MFPLPLSLRFGFICILATGAIGLAAKPIILVNPVAIPPSATVVTPDEPTPNIAVDTPQFESTPSPLPAEISHLGFETTGTSEFGDLIRLDGAAHFPGDIGIVMSSEASRSMFPGASPLGFTHPITLTLYSVDRSSGIPQPGAAFATFTENFLMPWRSERLNANGTLPASRAFTVTFHVGERGLSVPDEVIFGVSFNTQHFGSMPIGTPGPYDYLGIGIVDQLASVGRNVEPDAVFWKASAAANYSDVGVTGTGWLRRDTGWVSYQPAVRFTDSAYGLLAEIAARLDATPHANRDSAAALRSAASLIRLALDRTLWDGNEQLHPAYGRYSFDLLAAAAEDLAIAAAFDPAAASNLEAAIGTLLQSSEVLANSALANAMVFGGTARHIVAAETALETAADHQLDADFSSAIDTLGAAWLEAQLSLH